MAKNLQNFCKKTKNLIIHHNSFLHPLDMIFSTTAIYKMHKFFIYLIIYSIPAIKFSQKNRFRVLFSINTIDDTDLLYLPKEELSLDAVEFTEYFV